MKFLSNKLKYRIFFYLLPFTFFLLTSQVKAKETISPLQKTCPSLPQQPRWSFETEKYVVYICSGDVKNPLGYYNRISKNDGIKLTLPITSKKGDTHIARKNEFVHVVTPYELLVTKYNRSILRERVINAIAPDGKLLVRGCPEGNNTFVEAETVNFIIYICGNNVPASFISIARNNQEKITVSLQSYNPRNAVEASRYVAVQDDIRYVLTSKVLRISQDNRTLVKEKVLRWN
jgi:hypothetical protein